MLGEALQAIERDATMVSFKHTGCGYFLTVTHPDIPEHRIVCNEPMVTGKVGGTRCGFIAFLERRELVLECYTFGNDKLPENVRELEVNILAEAT